MSGSRARKKRKEADELARVAQIKMTESMVAQLKLLAACEVYVSELERLAANV